MVQFDTSFRKQVVKYKEHVLGQVFEFEIIHKLVDSCTSHLHSN